MSPFVMGVFALILIGASMLWVIDLIRTRPCPYCREKIDARAVRCPKCQANLASGG